MASVQTGRPARGPRLLSLVNNPQFRGIVFQIAFAVALAWFAWDIVHNASRSLAKANIASGYGFLDRTAGFGIVQSLIDYSESRSYGRAIVVGLINTLLVAAFSIALATVLGFTVGIARLSRNWLVRQIAGAYVELIRNIPLLLQLFFWYFAVLRAVPGMREKLTFLKVFHLNIAGLHAPRPVFGSGALWVVAAALAAVVLALLVRRWGRRRLDRTGISPPVARINAALIIGLPLAAYFLAGQPLGFDVPQFNDTGPLLRRGFQAGSGVTILPEFIGLLLALSIYTAAYIAEVVRAGILAVSHGQTEAALSLGLRPGQTLRFVVIPQALRVIIPPLTNQYLNLTKNSSLAVAIGYPDLVSVGGTVLNQTGQAVEMVSIWMAFYLGLSLLTSLVMNYWNRRVALVER